MTGGTDGHAEDHGRVYQSRGDQHISEHHHYGGDGPAHGGPDSVRRPAVGRPPVALRDRSEVMERLRASVEGERGGQVYVLYGMGGSGKTAVACALFQEVTGERERVGLWVNASDRASLRAGMLAVAADRGAGDGELLAARNGLRPAADLVWTYLDRSAEPWLLVLDNTDEPEILRDGDWLRTSPRGTVLVTTRRAAARWWPGAELQHIGVLPRDDAALVLRDLAPHSGTAEQAARIADRLGRLPLALSLAGGFLSHQVIDPWTMDTYADQLDGDERVRLIDRGADALSEADPRHLVGLTWQLTLDAFEVRGLPEARRTSHRDSSARTTVRSSPPAPGQDGHCSGWADTPKPKRRSAPSGTPRSACSAPTTPTPWTAATASSSCWRTSADVRNPSRCSATPSPGGARRWAPRIP